MRMRRSYVVAGGAALILFLLFYRFPHVFHLSGRDMKQYEICDGVQDFMNQTIRQSHLVVEVKTMKPDVACFQEMDERWYDQFWYPHMTSLGYEGMLGVDQSGTVKSGQALFWKKKKFNVDYNEKHFYHDLVKTYVENTLEEQEQTEFLSWFRSRALLLLAELEEVKSRSKVIVGCTHISASQHESPAKQTLQISLALQKMDSFSQKHGTKAMILSGDFNTPPHYPGYEFIKSGQLTPELEQSLQDKTPLHTLEADKKKFALDVLKLMPTAFTHNAYLRSAYHTVMGGEPLSTSLGDHTLDYTWFSPDSLVPCAVLREPGNSHVLQSSHHATCRYFPSDHIPILVQFYFKTETEKSAILNMLHLN